MKTIVIANHKGGVGKTTTAYNTAHALAQQGKRVLAIDLDPQRNLTYCLSATDYETAGQKTVADAILRAEQLPCYNVSENLDVCPGAVEMIQAPARLTLQNGGDVLKRALETVAGKYDVAVIDCPPGAEGLTIHAVSNANYIVAVLTLSILDVNGVKTLEAICRQLGKEVTGYLITMYENLNIYKSVLKSFREQRGDKIFKTMIRKNVSVREAPLFKQSIFAYAPKSTGAADYKAYTEELLQRIINN